MQKQWPKENIDLTDLATEIMRLLEREGFEVTEIKTETGYRIVGENSPRHQIEGGVSVIIDESPETFSVSLNSDMEGRNQRLSFPITLAAMMGGGYFVLKRLKSDEARVRFEKDFWKLVDGIIEDVKRSMPDN
jgi:hypothetical protein